MDKIGDGGVDRLLSALLVRVALRDDDLLPEEGQRHAVEFAFAITIGNREARGRHPLHVAAALQAALGNGLDVSPGLHRAWQFLFDRTPNMIAQTNQGLERRLDLPLLTTFLDL